MNIAAIETSTRTQSIALSTRAGITAVVLPAVSTHGRELASALGGLCEQAGIRLADVGCFLVGAGPGSFTGLRVGLAFARGAALASSAEVRLRSSLRAMAWRAGAAEGVAAIALDARRGELWSAVYEAGPQPVELLAPAARTPQELARRMQELLGPTTRPLLLGDGWHTDGAELAPLLGGAAHIDVAALPLAEDLLRVELAGPTDARGLGPREIDYLRDADAALPAVAQSRMVP